MQALLREQMGMETFAIAGDKEPVSEPWQDRPHLYKTPSK